MAASTHRALLVLDIAAADHDQARDVLDSAVHAAAVDPHVIAVEASPPVSRRHVPESLELSDYTDVHLAAEDAKAAGYAVQAFLRAFDDLSELMQLPAIVNRNKLEEIALRLTGGDVLDIPRIAPEPHPGEVFPLHRGSRA